jgi:hypothetical protein
MSTSDLLPWLGLLGLGALHGINPGMGWLFAVALGLQQQDRRAVWGALLPLGAGHALAIVAAAGIAALVSLVVPLDLLKILIAGALAALGLHHATGHRHPRYGGMRVSARELTTWSFLMGSAHGAGLMALPLVIGVNARSVAGAPAGHHAGGGMQAMSAMDGLAHPQLLVLLATAVHAAGYLLVTGAVAAVVYERLGLRLLRTAWLNIDLVWAVALIVSAVLMLVL